MGPPPLALAFDLSGGRGAVLRIEMMVPLELAGLNLTVKAPQQLRAPGPHP